VVLTVERATITGQLLDVIVDRIDQIARRDMRLGVEDQIMPQLAKLLKVRGDGCGPRFLAPPPPLFLLVRRVRGGAVSAFVIPATKAFWRGRRKLSIRSSAEQR
jgi:hypothetical protein